MVTTRRTGKTKAKGTLVTATWNVRSLVEDAGDAKICRKNKNVSDTAVDRKLDFLVEELGRFGVDVAGIQETKWFGSDVWPAGSGTLLHSGRPLPLGSEPGRRNEGVGILMNSAVTGMWKSGGEQWSAVSSRIVTARLLVAKRGDKLPGGGKRHADFCVSIVNVYAPTSKAPPNVRRKFFDDLQRVVDSIPSRDVLVLLGDLNARVGSSTDYADSAVSRIDGMPGDERMWGCVLGQFGLGNCNRAGEELLSFCAANQLSVMNTWYKKGRSKRGTWTHPATRQVHLIDYVIMRTAHCCYCKDVGVVRGALCWTDHYMVRAKLVLDFVQRRSTVPKRRSYATHRLREPDTLLQYRESMEAACGGAVGGGQSVEETWNSLRDDITSVAERTLGHGRRRQPDWFLENRAALEPLIEAKRRAHERMLSAGNQTTRSGFRSAQRSVARAVRGAKEQWIREVVGDAERAQRDGCVRWKCIRKLQRVDDGRRTVTPSAVYDGDGHLTDSPESLVTRWHAHFDRVLNIASQFSMHVIDNMPTAEPRHELDMAPTFEEVMAAMRRMSRGTAGGSSGIVPELVLGGGLALHRRIHSLISQIWAGGSVVSEWRDAEIVPIPKKGDLRSCDNWRGISLLDVVGKLFARVIQDRLQELSEDVLPESQCGFRKGRGCVDMVFVARQLIEKAIEHDTPLYVIFVDLKKAYDSIPREALWLVLGKLGIPPTLLSLIRSLHVGMRARVRISGRLTEDIYVNNGLRQGCTLAPTLFNLYFAAVMSSWRSRSSVPGVSLRSRPGRKLVGDRTTKARLNTYQVTESQFADDAAVYTTSREHLETLANEFIACASQWGLTVSIAKTKAIAVGPGDLQPDVVLDDGGVVEMVSGFTYLGSVVSCDGSLDVEITSRLAKASRVFGCLLTPIFRCRGLSIDIKCTVYRAFVLSTLFYGAETWAVKATHVHRLTVFHRSCIRSILGVSRIQQWEDGLTSAELGRRFGMSLDISDLLRQHRLRWLGHIARMEEHRTPQQMVFGELYATRPRHGPKKRWRDVVVTDLAAAQIGEGEWFHQAQDRPTWKRLCRQQPPPPGPKEFRCACGRPFGRIGDLRRHAPHCRV